MKQIIKFVDSDVDGCGTNVEMLIQIEGKNPLSTELVDALKHTIHEYIDSNAGEWSTDDVVIRHVNIWNHKGIYAITLAKIC